MAYERFKSTWDNFCKFIYQFQPETKTLMRKLERILMKLYWQNVPLLLIQMCLNMICKHIFLITFLNEPELIFCTLLNGFKYF